MYLCIYNIIYIYIYESLYVRRICIPLSFESALSINFDMTFSVIQVQNISALYGNLHYMATCTIWQPTETC